MEHVCCCLDPLPPAPLHLVSHRPDVLSSHKEHHRAPLLLPAAAPPRPLFFVLVDPPMPPGLSVAGVPACFQERMLDPSMTCCALTAAQNSSSLDGCGIRRTRLDELLPAFNFFAAVASPRESHVFASMVRREKRLSRTNGQSGKRRRSFLGEVERQISLRKCNRKLSILQYVCSIVCKPTLKECVYYAITLASKSQLL